MHGLFLQNGHYISHGSQRQLYVRLAYSDTALRCSIFVTFEPETKHNRIHKCIHAVIMLRRELSSLNFGITVSCNLC